MKRLVFTLFIAVALGLAACAGTPTSPPGSDRALACVTPHGFALLGDEAAASPLAGDRDVADVRVVPDPEKSQSALSIRLNDEASARVAQYSVAHVGAHVSIRIENRIISRLTVRDPTMGPSFLLTGASEDDVAQMRVALCGPPASP